VEDDAAIRANVRDCLQQLGYTALESGSGEDALQLCEQHHGSIDLVMTDLVMPGMSGHETAQRMSERFPGTRLLYTSGYSEDGAARRELLHEGAAFLEKPYTVADLARAVQRALTAQRLNPSTSAAEEIERGRVTVEG
jgi:CheY-like chemotaxis protein